MLLFLGAAWVWLSAIRPFKTPTKHPTIMSRVGWLRLHVKRASNNAKLSLAITYLPKVFHRHHQCNFRLDALWRTISMRNV